MEGIDIKITMGEALHFSNTICKSFFYKYGSFDRFVPMIATAIGQFVEDIPDDNSCSMYFTDDYLKAIILPKCFIANGYSAFVLYDELMSNEDEYIVLVNKIFNCGTFEK